MAMAATDLPGRFAQPNAAPNTDRGPWRDLGAAVGTLVLFGSGGDRGREIR